eukprot:COSAG06_NODE_6195_length_3054_cov_8.894078_3_plen_48_part_00
MNNAGEQKQADSNLLRPKIFEHYGGASFVCQGRHLTFNLPRQAEDSY